MKKNVIVLVLLTGYAAAGQSFTDKISREWTFEKPSSANALIVSNINGGITVTTYEGTKVLVEITRSIDAKTDMRLERGKEDLQLGVMDRADTIILYVRDGCHEFRRNTQNGSAEGMNKWGYHSKNSEACEQVFDYRMDFVIRVPASLNLAISTVNNGDIVVENAEGVVKADNINGNIRLANLRNAAYAHTINGDVKVNYRSNPDKPCRFYTLNGNIDALFQPGLSADLAFDSFNGDLYTNVSGIEQFPAQVQTTGSSEGLRYKISGSQFKIRNGGPLLDFETFNGNVYLKEK